LFKFWGGLLSSSLEIEELIPWIKGFGFTLGEWRKNVCVRYSEKIAVKEVESGRFLSYKELNLNSNKVANGLLGLGIKKGDPVVLFTCNRLEYLVLEQALHKIGAIRVSLNERLSSDYLRYIINDSAAKMVVTDHELLGKVYPIIQEKGQQLKVVCVSDGNRLPSGVLDFEELLKYSEEEPKINVDEQDIAQYGYTGGTTGFPKGVVRTHKADFITYVFEAIEWDITDGEKMLWATPLPHVAGLVIPAGFLKGATAYIMKKFDIPKFLETIEKEKITWTFLVPTMVYMLLEHPDLRKYDLSSLRTIIYGASPMSPEKLKQAVKIFGPIFIQIYGQYEVPDLISRLTKEEHLEALQNPSKQKRLASAGKPHSWVEVKIVDDNDVEVPRGTIGEIVVRAPHMMLGYLNKPEVTAETLKNGWLHTGDVGYMDEDGYLYIIDRKKDMIISGGMNVYSAEVEKVLHEHPAVKDVAVIGVPDEKWGEAVKAIVALKQEYKPSKEIVDDIIRFAKEKLPAYAVPKSVDFIDEIPVTPYGKIDKKKLREPYWKGLERKVH